MGVPPRIVAFLCDHCAYNAADAAGRERLEIPRVLLAVRVMCTGRVSLEHVVQAFREGADGVLVAGCHPGDCHYRRGNLEAEARVSLLAGVLAELGIEAERLQISWFGASESDRFAEAVRGMAARLEALGPLDYGSRIARAEPHPAPTHAPIERRPRVAFYWNASCGGCEEAVVDLGETLHEILAVADVVLWPVALDARKRDVEALADGDIDFAFINGAVRTEEQLEWAELLRRKARIVVAFGACAHMGGVVGLGNVATADEIAATAGGAEDPSDLPADHRDALRLPRVLPRVLPLSEAVAVDCTLPGCPPTTEVIVPAIHALFAGVVPPHGAVLSPGLALCEACDRLASRPTDLGPIPQRDIALAQPSLDKCFLAEGFACLGPATRQGCGGSCLRVNAPCRGCFGPPDGVGDQGAAFLDAYGSLVAGGPLRALADPLGASYRYSLAAATLPVAIRGSGSASGPTPRDPVAIRGSGSASGPTPRAPVAIRGSGSASGPTPRAPARKIGEKR